MLMEGMGRGSEGLQIRNGDVYVTPDIQCGISHTGFECEEEELRFEPKENCHEKKESE